MPARVHAIIVARSGSSARAQLLRTLDALRSQSAPAAAITLVMCGDATSARESPVVGSLVEAIIEARSGASFAEAAALAIPRVAEGSAVWLLAQDTAPHPKALARMVGALERSPSAALVAPKLVQTDDEREIVSLGVSMTRLGRTVELAEGELDQGQHDGRDDALGSDVRGILIRSELTSALRPDPALRGADEGLDLGVRARLGGGRVVLAPTARVSAAPDGPAALPRGTGRRAYVTRVAQLHRRLTYAPAAVVPLHWLTLLPLALWRSITHLIGKRPGAVLPEWAAAVTAMFRFPAIARSRRQLASLRTTSWSSISALRVSSADLRRRLDDGHGDEDSAHSELHFFSGGGAWAVLSALVLSVASFTSLLAWPALGGGALLPLSRTLSSLWADAAWGMRDLGVNVVGPADPFAAVIAVLGSLWPAGPSFILILLWILALPLAVLGGWFAATRVTDRAGLRIFAGVVWALAPTFVTALVDGRPAAVLVHLLLPWLFHAGVVAHRSWGAAGAAALLFAAVTACSPSLAPALLLLWMVALGITLAQARLRGAARVLCLPVVAVALFAPLVGWQMRHGSLVAVLADPGFIWSGPQATADVAGRTAIAGGFPTGDFAGWAAVIGADLAPWAAILLAPLALLALLAPLARRWRAGVVMLLVSVSGLATAFISVGIVVSFTQGNAVAIWPGAGLSLTWIGVVGAALVTLDTALTMSRVRVGAALVAAAAVVLCAAPALTAMHAGRSVLVEGQASTLPAYVAAQAGDEDQVGTLVLTAQNDGGLASEVVWGASETLGAQTTMLSTATAPQGEDITILAVDLLSARDFDAAAELGQRGIGFILLAKLDGAEGDRARSLRMSAITALDQRAGFVQAGSTDRGMLYRLDQEVTPRAGLDAREQATSRVVTTLQLIVVLAAVLLAIPTRASLRAARRKSRIVGRAPDEPLVLPRHADSGESLVVAAPHATDESMPGLVEEHSAPAEAPETVSEEQSTDVAPAPTSTPRSGEQADGTEEEAR